MEKIQLEEYFDFQAPDDIRLKGTRIGIESVLYEYIHRGQTAEQIAARFHTLSLEQVYATILYYLHNTKAVSAYLADYLEYCRKVREESQKNPPPVIEKLRQLKTQREIESHAGREPNATAGADRKRCSNSY